MTFYTAKNINQLTGSFTKHRLEKQIMNLIKRTLRLFLSLILINLFVLPCVFGKPKSTEKEPIKIYIAGNSTASKGKLNGWGSHLQTFFDTDKLIVENRAFAGRSSRTFITEGLWDNLCDDLKPGDYVLIEFGHNDAGAINDTHRARGSIASLGEEILEIDNLKTGKHEVVHSFGWYMRKMINDTKDKGATPIVMSMTTRNVWSKDPYDRQIERRNDFCSLAKLVAKQEGIEFIDLRNMIADQYQLLGPHRVIQLFPKDHTHTGADGAKLNAAMVVSGLKYIDCPVTKMLSEEGESVTEYGEYVFVKQMREWMEAAWMPDVQPKSDPNLPTLYCIGNSTVRNGRKGDGSNGEWGWGAPIADFFDRSKINIENKAMGGTSSRTFRSSGLWQPILDNLKAGDYVIIQFGHNDSSPINDSLRARGTIKNNSNDSIEIDNILTGKHEVVYSYGWYIRKYIKEIKAKGATPIVCSLIPQNKWTDGKVNLNNDGYPLWAKQAAKEEDAYFINLNELLCTHYNTVGEKRVRALYFKENEKTHTNALGAQINATCVVKGIKAHKDLSLNNYLKVFVHQ